MFSNTFGSLKIDVDPLSFLILICISVLTLCTHSERVSKSSLLRFAHCRAYSSTESIIILKLCFEFMDLGSRYVSPLANTSRREVLMIILTSPVIAWPAELYMNGELAHVQAGGLDFKSSILRSSNPCL